MKDAWGIQTTVSIVNSQTCSSFSTAATPVPMHDQRKALRNPLAQKCPQRDILKPPRYRKHEARKISRGKFQHPIKEQNQQQQQQQNVCWEPAAFWVETGTDWFQFTMWSRSSWLPPSAATEDLDLTVPHSYYFPPLLLIEGNSFPLMREALNSNFKVQLRNSIPIKDICYSKTIK